MLGKDAQLRKIRLKILQAVYDLLLNDDSILQENRNIVRETLGKDAQFIERMLDLIKTADFTANPEAQIREYVLNSLFRVY